MTHTGQKCLINQDYISLKTYKNWKGVFKMAVDNPTVKWVLIGLAILLLVPVVVMLGMMAISGAGMMSHMAGMMGSSGSGMMSTAAMVLCGAWLALVAGALVFLIVLLARSAKSPDTRDKAA